MTLGLAEDVSDPDGIGEDGLPEARGLPLLIHVGPHKTGTTWLQRRFFSNARGLVYSGDFRKTHAAFLVPRFGDFDLGKVRGLFGPLIERARSENLPLVISDEALGGRPFHQKYYREITAYRLRRAFPEAKILVTIREQDAVLRSMYGEYLRYGYSSSLRAFLTQDTGNPNLHPILDLAFYDYDRTLDFYESLFGPAHVMASPMEWVLSDKQAFVAHIGQFLGAEIGLPDDMDTDTRERPAWSGWARRAQRSINSLTPQDSRWQGGRNRFSANSIAFRIDRITPHWARMRGIAAEKRLVRDMIGSRFVASNRRLAERTGLDLGAFGYRV